MFSKKDHLLFIVSLILSGIGFSCMALDPSKNGMGNLTLWIAPPLLLVAFALPVAGILGTANGQRRDIRVALQSHTLKYSGGFLVFALSLCFYLVTLEPTASLWDCSEFIAAAYKLQVPHTPGTPLSLLIARLFTLFAFGDVTQVARCINAMSALFSALSVWLVFAIIYAMGEKISTKKTAPSALALTLASAGGSLCLAFSDSFWFSAVEAETYGAACFFLLLILWLILKGQTAPEPTKSRYLILIFYTAGLGYCIHPMCLLALPVLPLAWFMNDRRFSFRNFLLLFLAGLILVLAISRLVAVGLFELAFYVDFFFVNVVHLPFYSGAVILLLFLIGFFAVMLKRYPRFAAFTWSGIFLLIGFLPYLILFIRSNHNPPIDETNPENLSMIKAYMNRETYPSSPLVYGPYFDAQVDGVGIKKKIYHQGKKRYEYSGTMAEYHYESSRSTILPRLYSNDPEHIKAYRNWTGLGDHEKPRFVDNVKFMLEYQLGHMYLRYFLWNFAGRDSDHQNSSWLSPWDSYGKSAASQYANKAHNQLYMIPLLLGVAGLYFQYKNDRKGFFAVMTFFLVTGMVLGLYLNSTPNEPRERDYIYVGSYIAFCIWIGLGVVSIYNAMPTRRTGFLGALFVTCLAPAWMLHQNYDDHNRSGRTFQVDNARNLLNSCAPNAILFTGGDNDTFPLWYLQEVEGHRTDVRVMVLSYLNTDWYINQLRRQYYQSAPFALTLSEKDYLQYGPNDVLYVQETIKDAIDVQKYFHLLKTEYKGLKVETNTGDSYNILPSRTLKIKVDREKIVKSDSIRYATSTLAPELTLHIDGNYLQKNALAVIDLILSNNWERPVYFNFTSLNTVGIDLNRYVIQEGNVFRLVPVEHLEKDIAVDTQLSFQMLIEKSDYKNLSDPNVYFNYEDYQARIITPARQAFNSLAIGFLEEGNPEKAAQTIRFAVEKLYQPHLEPSYTNLQAADILFSLGDKESGKSLCASLFDFHYGQLLANIEAHRSIDRSAIWLVEQAAEMLHRMGEEKYLVKTERLGIGYRAAK